MELFSLSTFDLTKKAKKKKKLKTLSKLFSYPGASSLIGTFLARAVVDDALPPSFVSTLPSGTPSPSRANSNANATSTPPPPPPPPPTTGAAAVRAAAEAALRRPHAAEALSGDACWGDAGATHAGGYAATRAAVAHILSDFLAESANSSVSDSSNSSTSSTSAAAAPAAAAAAAAAASQRFCALRSPFCGHELVKQAVLAAADAADEAVNGPRNKGAAKEEGEGEGGEGEEGEEQGERKGGEKPADPAAVAAAVAGLLSSLAEAGTVSSSQMAKGFERVEACLPQLGPEAAAAAEKLAEDGERGGWLERNEGSGSGSGVQISSSSPTSSSRPAPFDADAPPPPHLAAAAAVPALALAKYKASALVAWDEYFASGDVDALAAALLASAASAARGANAASSLSSASAAAKASSSSSTATAAAAVNGNSATSVSTHPPLSSSPPPPVDQRAFSWAAVKVGVRLACDRRAAEREAASVALASLVGDSSKAPANSPLGVISHEAAATGFLALLDAAEDLALDVPAAPRLLSLFVARAVVDEVLPPSFLADAVPALRANSLGLAAVAAAGASLGARHAAERALGCWSVAGGALRADDRSSLGLKGAMQAALEEFQLCGPGDAAAEAEVAACLRELDAPFYHHEFVKRALTAAATASAAAAAAAATRRSSEGGGGGGAAAADDDNDEEKLTPAEARLLDLLARLTATGEVSQTQAARGTARFAASVDDLALDCPGARASAARLEKGLAERGIGK